nr:hypothetical protein CFP56_68318 [Quercus suber]
MDRCAQPSESGYDYSKVVSRALPTPTVDHSHNLVLRRTQGRVRLAASVIAINDLRGPRMSAADSPVRAVFRVRVTLDEHSPGQSQRTRFRASIAPGEHDPGKERPSTREERQDRSVRTEEPRDSRLEPKGPTFSTRTYRVKLDSTAG